MAQTANTGRNLRNQRRRSIDNDESRDPDQLTFAEAIAEGPVKILIAVAKVDAVVTSVQTS